MTIGSLELKKKYPVGSCKKTTLWESWQSSNSPMQRLLSLIGRYYQSDGRTKFIYHSATSITISFLLWVPDLYALHHRRACVIGSFKQTKKSDTRSVRSALGEWLLPLFTLALWLLYKKLPTSLPLWSVHSFWSLWAWSRGKLHRTTLLQRDWWHQLASSHHPSFALYRQYAVDLLPLSSERVDLFCTEAQDSRCCYLQLCEET